MVSPAFFAKSVGYVLCVANDIGHRKDIPSGSEQKEGKIMMETRKFNSN